MRTIALALLTATALGAAAPAFAQDVCQQLWVERNSIYKANGYCFKTWQAIRYFGNAGCMYDEEWRVPLSRRERARIDYLKAMEARYGCRW